MNRQLASELRHALADPVHLAALLGLEITRRARAGAPVIVRCPWHDERTPSCSLSRGRDGTIRVRCFGCGATGDALTLIATARHLDLRRQFLLVLGEAATLARMTPPRMPGGDSPRTPARSDAAISTKQLAAMLAPILHLGRLDESPITSDATAYLRRRGVLDEARRDGWAALPAKADTQQAWIKMLVDAFDGGVVEGSGLVLRRRSGDLGFAWPEHRLVIPWRDVDARVVTVQRRRLAGDGAPKYVFPPSSAPRMPYGIDRLRDAAPDSPISIVEGAFDVLAARALYREHGLARIPLGLPGVGAWRREWAELGRGREVFIATDADAGGDGVVAAIARDFARAGARQVFRARPVGGKDWGNLIGEAP